MITTDDQTAIYILRSIAQSQLKPASGELTLNPALAAALAATFSDVHQTSASEGELARAALALLSEDAAFAEPIRLMTSQAGSSARPQRYIDPSTIALTTAVLLALQTRVKFKADQNGKWSIELDKKSSNDATLKLVVQRLLSFLVK